MKIQDLRDDLAEMRYFKKSHLRKMKSEMGGPMLPMPFDRPSTVPSGHQPMLPDGGSRYIDNDDGTGTVRPYTIDDVVGNEAEIYQQLWDLLRSLTGTMM